MPRKLSEIAKEIKLDWKNINAYALPYLEAMELLETVTDTFGMDDGETITIYFLSNAKAWRGDVARRIKSELKSMI